MRGYFILLLVLILFLFYGCVAKEDYKCPSSQEGMEYDPLTDTYIEWVSCKPPAPCDKEGMEKYEKWVNKNCDVKYKIKIAY